MFRNLGFAAPIFTVFTLLILGATPALAVTQGIALTNGNFEQPGPDNTKVVAFDETGTPLAPNAPIVTLSSGQLAGGVPGWTFTGGSGIAASGEVNAGLGNTTFGDGLPGDSGTEGGGNPANELILSTLDGKVFQTSSFNVVSLTANEKYRLSFDAHNIYTPTGMGQLMARLYYVDGGGNRQTLGTAFASPALAGFVNFAIELRGDVPADVAAINSAIGRPIGVEFDTTSREFDPTVTESWAGVDNVLMQITGVKRGDFNGDGLINAADYAILRDHMQQSFTYEFQGELTGDYFVNLNDFRAVQDTLRSAGHG